MTDTLERSRQPHSLEESGFNMPEIVARAEQIVGPLAVVESAEDAKKKEAQRIRKEISEIQRRIKRAKLGGAIWHRDVLSSGRTTVNIDGKEESVFPMGNELAITTNGNLLLAAHRDVEEAGGVFWKEIDAEDLSYEAARDSEGFFTREHVDEYTRSGSKSFRVFPITTKDFLDRAIEQAHLKEHHPQLYDLDV